MNRQLLSLLIGMLMIITDVLPVTGNVNLVDSEAQFIKGNIKIKPLNNVANTFLGENIKISKNRITSLYYIYKFLTFLFFEV